MDLFHSFVQSIPAVTRTLPQRSFWLRSLTMGRVQGAKNYKKEVLLEVVKEVLPTGAFSWEQVCALYKERAKEEELRDKDDVKRHWNEKMCNKFMKPTGSAGGARDFILRCQKVQALIHKKCESSLMGGHSEDDDESGDDGSSEEGDVVEGSGSGVEVAGDDGDNRDRDNEVCVVVPALPPLDPENTADENPLPVDEEDCPDAVSGTDKASDPQLDVSLAVRRIKHLSHQIEIHLLYNEFLSVGEKTTSFRTPTVKKSSPKTKNSTNKKRANIGLSIEKLCEQISKSNQELTRMETRSVPPDTGLSQMFAMQMFQGQMMGQERRIEAIEKQSNDIMGLMKKMMKDQKKQKKEKRKKKRKRAHLEKKKKARKVTSEKWTKDTE